MGDHTAATTAQYLVPGMTCDHCKAAVTEEVNQVAGVHSVDVDLDSKVVSVHGEHLDDDAICAAIEEAGYESTPAG